MIVKFNVLPTHISANQLSLLGSVKYSPKSSYIMSLTLSRKAESIIVLVVYVVNETYVD